MIFYSSQYALSTVFGGPDASCTRSARPDWKDGAVRVVRVFSLWAAAGGVPALKLCSLEPVVPSVSAQHVQFCRPDYRVEPGEPVGGDATLFRAVNQPSINSTARAIGPTVSTGR
jgi:hypothetical protein